MNGYGQSAGQQGVQAQPQSQGGQSMYQPLQQAADMIQQAQVIQAQGTLTKMGVSNISQQIIKAEQLLNKVQQDLQLTANQLQSQMDAQQRQIMMTQQNIQQAIDQFHQVDRMVIERINSTLQ